MCNSRIFWVSLAMLIFVGLSSCKTKKEGMDDSAEVIENVDQGSFDQSEMTGRRKVVHRNVKEILAVDIGEQAGKEIVARVCVDNEGKVVFAELLDDETTAKIPKRKKKKIMKGFFGYRYEPDASVDREQCGRITVVLSK